MTRKRYINLVRAILTEMPNHSDVKPLFKNFESGFNKLPVIYAKIYGSFSYAELFKAYEHLAHRYGIGGY